MMSLSQRSAFSLIEFSIVLVIIGILVAAVTKGSSLINSARLASARSVTSKSPVPNISGLVAWYETSLSDSLKVSETIDGQQITTWYDVSPGSVAKKKNSLIAAFGTALFKTSGINKIPSISFSGNDKLTLSAFYQGSSAQSTIFIVASPSSLSGVLVDSANGQGTSTVRFTSTGLNINCGSGVSINFSIPPQAGTSYIIASYLNSNNSKAYSNDATTIAGGGVINVGSNSLQGLTVGTDRNSATGFSGLISEIIIYNRPLQNQERKDVMAYLSKKYQIAVTGI